MLETWRWSGPDDPASLSEAAQVGAQGIVTALHHFPPGAVWPPEQIAILQARITRLADGTPSGMASEVVESVFMSEDIKTRSGDWRAHRSACCQTLVSLAAARIKTVAYTFMPVHDWTRTDLAYARHNGARALRYYPVAVAAFDLHILERGGAEVDYPPDVPTAARAHAKTLDAEARQALSDIIIARLPGAGNGWTPARFLNRLVA